MADKDKNDDSGQDEPVTDLVKLPQDGEAQTDAPTDDPHEDEEEGHFSLAARSLQILMILFVGAGIGIWAAPKIAPLLPKGLAPLAHWLSPQDNASMEEVAALRQEVSGRLATLEALPGRAEFERRLAGFQTDVIDPLRTQMQALSDQVAAADSTAIESRLWALESRVEGLIAEFASLTESLGNVESQGGTISADMAASIAAYRTRIDAMQAEIDNLVTHQGEFAQTLDQLNAKVDGQLETARAEVVEVTQDRRGEETLAQINAAVQSIDAALISGAPFVDALAAISSASDVDIPDPLPVIAQTGVLTLDDLQQEFVPAAHEAIRISISAEAEEGGALASIGAFMRAQVATRSLTEQEGDSVDAILSRVEGALHREDLAGAIATAKTLPDPAQAAMQGWMDHAQQRLDALAAVDSLVTALNLGE